MLREKEGAQWCRWSSKLADAETAIRRETASLNQVGGSFMLSCVFQLATTFTGLS
jgi:hypothetical protein